MMAMVALLFLTRACFFSFLGIIKYEGLHNLVCRRTGIQMVMVLKNKYEKIFQ
jgi:hypothetical protein